MPRIEFFRDKRLIIDGQAALKALGALYLDLRGACELHCIDDSSRAARFDLDLVMADVLKALGLLDYENLSVVVGRGRAVRAWRMLKMDPDP